MTRCGPGSGNPGLKARKTPEHGKQITARLNVSVRTISNYSNHKWLSERGIAHLPDLGQELQEARSAWKTKLGISAKVGITSG